MSRKNLQVFLMRKNNLSLAEWGMFCLLVLNADLDTMLVVAEREDADGITFPAGASELTELLSRGNTVVRSALKGLIKKGYVAKVKCFGKSVLSVEPGIEKIKRSQHGQIVAFPKEHSSGKIVSHSADFVSRVCNR